MMIEQQEPKIMFIRGYHEDEAAIGREITASYLKQFGQKNIIFYEPEDNIGSIGGEFCDKVEKQLGAIVNILKPDLCVDIHDPCGIPREMQTEKVRCEIELMENFKSILDWLWYFDFVKSDPSRLINQKTQFYGKSKRAFTSTDIVIEFYICLDDREEFGHEVYCRRIDEAAQILNNIVDSYRDFRSRYNSDPAYKKYMDERAEQERRYLDHAKELISEGWEIEIGN